MSEDFQKALKEACDNKWQNWLYGGGFIKVAKEEVPEVLDEIMRKKREIEKETAEIKRKSDDLKKRGKRQMFKARAMATARGLNVPSFEGLSPEEIREVSDEMRCKAEFNHNPQVKRIREIIDMKTVGKVRLICPKCGDPDYNNWMNKTPWCLKCNVALMEPDKIGKWVYVKQGNMDKVKDQLKGLPE